ncbi:hypothetical protein O6H91_19G013100 [Diphasiastrum complanatum]|uniref:Uncharacterized protein n=1 Tax=Diphasiastrum complanatum TaxID=34168 RepID=A0ACC2ASY9_DIPCM|nr:hypothetical protein O6H91_19G013100 [Diphasiastrum complanatum]
MEGIVWQNLPEDLIEKVLATLPVSTLPKMRAVCKAWSSLILSQPFIEFCARTCGRQDHLLCFTTVRTKCTLAAFNLASNNWQSSSLNFRGSKRPVFFVAAGAGLILLNDRYVDVSTYCLYNPFTRVWTDLPPIPQAKGHSGPPLVAGIFERKDTKSYSLVVAGSNGYSRKSTYVFDSLTRTWQASGSLPQIRGDLTDGIVCGSYLHALASLTKELLSFDIKQGIWIKRRISFPPHASYLHLTRCSGTLQLVALVDAAHIEDDRTIRIWELSQKGNEWQELGAMPADICASLLQQCDGLHSFKCVWHGEVVYFSTYDCTTFLAFNVSLYH